MSNIESESPSRLSLVLSAGGARAAYQVGVLRYIGQNFPDFNPTLFCGVSAGSINASFLAQGLPFDKATEGLYQLWSEVTFDKVLRTNFNTLASMFARWVYDLFVSKVTQRLLLKSLLDASPLASTLLDHIHFWKVTNAIRKGMVHGLAITATNYFDGATTIFYDSHEPIEPWSREQRRALRTNIRIRHIMASCSIPVIFEPIPIGDSWYGDGSLRFSFPISPALHLGASHVFAISIRTTVARPATPSKSLDHLSLGFVAGSVLNSIFLDSLDIDFENLQRMNRKGAAGSRPIEGRLIRPSQDLGAIAKEFINEVPFHLKQILRGTARPEDLGDVLSYLMFSPGYVNALLKLGMSDAENHHDSIAKFVSTLSKRERSQASS